MKVKLEALKRQTYNTRHLEAGDVFEADRKFARVLIAQKRAKEATGGASKVAAAPEPNPEPAPDPAPPVGDRKPPEDDLADLRTEYERVVGKRPFYAWDAEQLRERMAAHQAKGGDEVEDAGND